MQKKEIFLSFSRFYEYAKLNYTLRKKNQLLKSSFTSKFLNVFHLYFHLNYYITILFSMK